MSHRCPGCGTALDPTIAVRGLCPACLLRMALTVEPDEPQFTILTPLAQGNRGTTFLAREDSGRADHVALTILAARGDQSSILTRFDRLRQTLLNLRHPNIARLLHIGRNDEGQVFVATEFVAGTPLPTALAGALPGEDRRAIGRQLRDAMEAAHRAGVLHLALRPSSVRVTKVGDLRIAKVLGFGLASVIDDARGTEADDLEALGQLLAMLDDG